MEADLPVHVFVALKDFAATDCLSLDEACSVQKDQSSNHQRSSSHAHEQRIQKTLIKKEESKDQRSSEIVSSFHLTLSGSELFVSAALP